MDPMANEIDDPRNPRGKCIQIKGAQNDLLICDVESLASRRGIPIATMARILLRFAVDHEKRVNP